MENNLPIKRAALYLAILYGGLLACWMLAIALPNPYDQAAYSVLWGLFSLFPVLATILSRSITKDQSPWLLKPNFRKSWKIYLFAAFAPGLTIFLGGLLFFVLFPRDLDLTAQHLIAQYSQFGAPEHLQLTRQTIFGVGFISIFISPLIFPVQIFALGEEIGWRGYLLPNLLKAMSQRKAILTHGFLWGLAHAPLIYFGFNYGSNYWGAPWSGMLMMILVCIVWGTWLARITLQSKSIIPSAIAHGAGNVIGELPVLVSLSSISPLVGPNPTGIIGFSGLLIGAIFLKRIIPKK